MYCRTSLYPELPFPASRVFSFFAHCLLMKIQLLNRCEPDHMTFERVKREYDIRVVRGSKSMPNDSKQKLNIYEGEI